jgi:hypothetical protein
VVDLGLSNKSILVTVVPPGSGYQLGYQRIVWRQLRSFGFAAMPPLTRKLQRRRLRPATFNHLIDQSTESSGKFFHVNHAGPDHGSQLGLRRVDAS